MGLHRLVATLTRRKPSGTTLGLGKSSMRVMPSVGSGRYSPGPGMAYLLVEVYQVIRTPLSICSLNQPGNPAIDSDFIGFRVSRHLAQRQVILHRPGADHMQGRLTGSAPSRTALGLTIDGDRLQFRRIERDGSQAMSIHQRRYPVGETPLKGQRVEQAEDATERIVRRYPPRQGQEGTEPVNLRLGVFGDLQPIIGPTQDGANAHENDLVKHVDFSMVTSRVRKRGEVLEDRGRVFGTRMRLGLGVDRHGSRP